jgi:hypothetical protein
MILRLQLAVRSDDIDGWSIRPRFKYSISSLCRGHSPVPDPIFRGVAARNNYSQAKSYPDEAGPRVHQSSRAIAADLELGPQPSVIVNIARQLVAP